MKNFYTLITIIAASFAANAQANLIPNGSFENWTAGELDDWDIVIPTNGGSVVEESTDFHDGVKSVKITAPAGTGNVQLKLTDFPVTAGIEYTFSYWYKDESDNARIRHWGVWRDNVANVEVPVTGTNDMKPNYMPNTTGWQEVTFTVTPPTGTTHLRLDFRTYKETGDSGEILLDHVNFFEGTTSIKENNIDGLNIFPNPADDVLNITSNSTLDKNVQLFDLTGKKVLDVTTVSQVNVSTLKAGIYVAKIYEAGKTATRKVVIK
ncbi:T9SS type A sorting domain-containing protein [Flavobacterium dauae]|uniref:T9SS type A sorting domain-containing protein n=1 Tax=Flavobacterium dauae TaxID=1563479 RepID=UPI00101B2836|nr:T9SS type A sorting domain-containing protein [Flavobacterium dauae]WLD23106.1 T9SS type A sorting domain-containing protein [Flavobacterium dauae]